MTKQISNTTEQSETGFASMIERIVLNPDIDVNKMEKLLDLQMRVREDQAKRDYATAMALTQGEVPRIIKDKRNTQTNSDYASHEALCAALKPIYTKNGFSLEFDTDQSPIDGHIRILCDCSHNGGFSKKFKADLPLDSAGIKGSVNKTPTHATGSTFSYGRRYLTLLIFNVPTGDDKDGNKTTDLITEDQANGIKERITIFDTNTSKAFFKWLERNTGAVTVETIPSGKLSAVLRSLETTEKRLNK